MKRNLNEQLSRIKSMMGLILETDGIPCETWSNGTFKNGDGVNTPKITINNDRSKIEGIYQGPESGFCIQSATGNDGDSVHQLATITVFHEGSKKHLKNLYNSGIFVRPDLENIVMVRRPNYFKITIPLIPTTEDKAITSINERGSMGGGTGGIDYTEYKSAKSKYPEMFYDKIKTVGDMTEHFFAFRILSQYPIKAQSGGQQQGQQTSSGISINQTKPATKKSLDELYKFNKNEFNSKPGKYSLSNFDITRTGTNITYTLNATPDQNGYPMLAMIVGDDAFNYVEGKNPNSELTKLSEKIINVYNSDTKQYQDYKIIITGIRDKK